MINTPVPVKVLKCFCVGKRRMSEEDIAGAVGEDQTNVSFNLGEFVKRGILIEDGSFYFLNPDFEVACKKIVEIYNTINLTPKQKLSGVYFEVCSGSETLFTM